MVRELDEDSNLTIRLLSYDQPTLLAERYYFHEMSTLQATMLLPQHKKIISATIFSHTDDSKYLDEKTVGTFKTIEIFNKFFLLNDGYYIHDCNIELEDGMLIGSHDDGEVSIEFRSDSSDKSIINTIFEKYNLDRSLIDVLKDKPGHYIGIDKKNNSIRDFKDFDDFIKNGRDLFADK